MFLLGKTTSCPNHPVQKNRKSAYGGITRHVRGPGRNHIFISIDKEHPVKLVKGII